MRYPILARLEIRSFVFLVLLGLGTLAGCQSTEPVTYVGLQEEIPAQANRILLYQEETAPADVYVDAINYFRRQDWLVTASEETMDPIELEEALDEDPLAFTVKKQVNDDLALEISAKVDVRGAGGQLIASADYASSITRPIAEWKQAEWTEGKARTAFYDLN